MKHATKERVPTVLPVLFAILLLASVIGTTLVIRANNQTTITYQFTGKEAADTGYAEGSLTLNVKESGTYYLYWADDTKALDGYYAIGDIDDTTTSDSSTDITKKQAYFHDMSAGESRTFKFEEHTAIPAGATKIIATTNKSNVTVKDAKAVFDIPEEKQLHFGSGNLLYTFSSYSDVHIDTEGYYQKSQSNWDKALKYAMKMNTDFIISSGDAITNAKGESDSKGGFADEWKTYQKILASSDYFNPVYESDGNHDMRTENKGMLGSGDTYKGITAFVQSSGTDSTVANVEANKPYYYVIEKNTGDVFIFMALENGSDPGNYDNFSKEQINWLKDLLDTYYGTGVNVYIIEHSPFRGYGAGDAWMAPQSGYIPSHYKSLMLVNGQTGKDSSNNYFTASGMNQNTEFKKLLEKYPDLIWMSGHTHQDFTVSTNYSDENDTSCHMIHNPSVAGTTYFTDANSESQEYNNGCGRTSQGYYVESYENAVVYYGANLYDEKIYPAYCYIMEGSRSSASVVTSETRLVLTPNYDTLSCDKELIAANADLSSALKVAKNLLDTYYTLSTYDQYQALKKYYYNYSKNSAISDASHAVTDLKESAEQLYALAKRLGKVSGDNPSGSTSDE
ncbi:MAG: metallophosphoesterase, partial [Lachnospiraceae bacterium]|nr:metallophosphoesterase [Lachnospiraceae bacterium]